MVRLLPYEVLLKCSTLRRLCLHFLETVSQSVCWPSTQCVAEDNLDLVLLTFSQGLGQGVSTITRFCAVLGMHTREALEQLSRIPGPKGSA